MEPQYFFQNNYQKLKIGTLSVIAKTISQKIIKWLYF